jgi:hypothetical protein
MKAPCPNCAHFTALADLAETPALVCRACRSGARLALEPLDVDGYRVPSRAELRELAAEVLAECERRERGH